MKIIKILSLILSLLFFMVFSSSILADKNNIINLYNWSAYLPNSVINQFTKETGIKVNYATFDSNETLYSKLKAAPRSGYDIIVPSNYFVERMASEGMLQPLDKSKLPNIKFLDPFFLNQPYDKNNYYSLPYLWGTTGIVINKSYITDYKTINSWKNLWRPEYNNKLMLLNDSREVFSVALLSLGYSVNDKNPEHIEQAYNKLIELLANIKLFSNDAMANTYIDEDATLGMAWNGDAYLASQENSNIIYTYPKEGFVIWIDCFALPKHAPHVENSYKFINFLLRPDISEIITRSVGFSSPNKGTYDLLDDEIKNNPMQYPDKKLLEKGQYQRYLGGKLTALYEKYWELLKTR